jgi:hypothetical protein
MYSELTSEARGAGRENINPRRLLIVFRPEGAFWPFPGSFIDHFASEPRHYGEVAKCPSFEIATSDAVEAYNHKTILPPPPKSGKMV